MSSKRLLRRHGIVRSAIKEDMLYFALPGLTVFVIELILCARDGLSGFWGTVWDVIEEPQVLSTFPVLRIIGLSLIVAGFVVAIVGQLTLWKNYSSTVVIREGHQLVTHGIYRFTRNPMYLGITGVLIGLPVYTPSLYGFFASLLLIPITLKRIGLEERLLGEASNR